MSRVSDFGMETEEGIKINVLSTYDGSVEITYFIGGFQQKLILTVEEAATFKLLFSRAHAKAKKDAA